jgi:hypothetical protein
MSMSLVIQMQFAQAVQCMQSGYMCECMGSGDMAVALYQQAVGGFTACAQALGPTAPPDVAEGLAFCQKQLAQLTTRNAIGTIANLVGAFLGGF